MTGPRQTISLFFILYSLGSILFPQSSLSQGLYNQSSVFVNGTNIYVDGEIGNEGSLVNDGTIAFTGDWESKGTYQGQGVLEVYGDAPQKISHHNQTVQTLVIMGWDTKHIKGVLNIEGELNLKQGIVKVSSEDALKLNAEAVTAGGSAGAYVDGALTVKGNGYKFFPVGKNGSYAPLEFLDVKGQDAEYSVEVFEDAPDITLEGVVVRSPLYWYRKDIAGNFGSSPVAVEFEPGNFQDLENMILLAGTNWEEPFASISDLDHSSETDKVATRETLSAPIIMLGEKLAKGSETDFYFSTALSPHAARPENRNVKIFGKRLADDQFHFQVFDRWGGLVYETISLEEMASDGWDGRTVNGIALTGGVYPYRLTAFDKKGKKFEKKGIITIIY